MRMRRQGGLSPPVLCLFGQGTRRRGGRHESGLIISRFGIIDIVYLGVGCKRIKAVVHDGPPLCDVGSQGIVNDLCLAPLNISRRNIVLFYDNHRRLCLRGLVLLGGIYGDFCVFVCSHFFRDLLIAIKGSGADSKLGTNRITRKPLLGEFRKSDDFFLDFFRKGGAPFLGELVTIGVLFPKTVFLLFSVGESGCGEVVEMLLFLNSDTQIFGKSAVLVFVQAAFRKMLFRAPGGFKHFFPGKRAVKGLIDLQADLEGTRKVIS